MTYPIPRASIWPNVVFDTSSAKGMAAAQAWMASHAPERPVEPRTGENDTQTHEDTQTATQTGDWEPTAPAPPVFNSIEPQTPTPQRRRTDRVLYGDIERNLNT